MKASEAHRTSGISLPGGCCRGLQEDVRLNRLNRRGPGRRGIGSGQGLHDRGNTDRTGPINELLAHIEVEYRLYKRPGEGTLRPMEADELAEDPENANCVAVIVWYLSGDLASRFTDFLTADGEKPWRQRDAEFESRHASRPEMMEKWERSWDILVAALGDLASEDLKRTVTIRAILVRVDAALLRSMARGAYHVGQIVYLWPGATGETHGSTWPYPWGSRPPTMRTRSRRRPAPGRRHARTSADGRARGDTYRQQARRASRALACGQVSRRQMPQPPETSRAETVA